MSDSAIVSSAAMRPPPPVRRWTRTRILGHILVGFWAAIALGLAYYLYSAWNFDLVARYGPDYLDGLITTVILVLSSVFIGAILSIPIAMGRMSSNRILATLAYFYVYFFRGTPLLAQVFLIYYGVGSFNKELQAIGLWVFFREAWFCALLSFALNTAAYQAEILRGAIRSVPLGQWEGAASLGVPKSVTFRKIILPQALVVALRPYGNEVILMIKGSAIVALISVYDLMGYTKLAYSRTFDFQTYLWTAIIYLILVELLRHLWDWMERQITRHLVR
ncbi:ABC transporter permease [Phyllobacterium sp. 21LDTY02-6]|jgi:polar amino acid transport system permease protein|uniref:ABC transporter permease n=1 Tax=unclassified Phyllobacterium TaxID=2638441 RepID=UPI0020226D26|nr:MULTISPECIES: ABC transporter permease [unclassified Phyllobacterium]MCO4316163.1 ABC transporter permease [Phyllobacterium sp. 21LDTY02-6]MCX8279414.1 ABC transporter permease [Phyllobacterium sp. 0TCS1.6C]MCX8292395.1 ABC transporter permease [Phyllobacterium sp. 0TCS1.6A]